ncbi:MAG: N-acetyltransferase family protein [Actinomycetota bacterium]
MRVRDAVEADLPRITDIFNQAIPAGNAEWTESLHTVGERAEWLSERRRRGFPVLVAEEVVDGEIVGVASYGDFRDSTCREGFRFTVEHSVYLDESAKGSGAATALMDALVEHARGAGVRQIVATIDATNPASLRFHERYGFVETGRLPDIGFTFDTWRTMVIMQLAVEPPHQR